MEDPAQIRKKRLRRALIVAAVILVIGGGAAGAYFWKMHRQSEHLASLKPTGMELLAQGEHRLAMTKLEGYLGKYPNDREALQAYAKARRQVREAGGAHIKQTIGILQRILQLNPPPEQAETTRRRLLDLYVQTDLRTEALNTAEKLLEAHPDDLQAMKAKAKVLKRMRNFDRAFEAAARYTERKPEAIAMQLTTLEIMRGQGRSAGELIDRAARLLAPRSEDGRFLMVKGYAHQLAGQQGEARAYYRRAGEHMPTEAAEVGRLAKLMHRVGLTELATDKLAQAEQAMDDPMLVRMLFDRLWQRGRIKQLLDRAESFDMTAPDASVDAVGLVGLARLEAGRREQVRPVIEALNQRDDELARDWVRLLEALSEKNVNGQRLADVASTAATRHPDHPYFHYYHGQGLAMQQKVEAAVKAWRQAAHFAEAWPEPLIRIARAFMQTDRASLAVSAAQAAVRRAPRHVAADMTLVKALSTNLDRLNSEQLKRLTQMAKWLGRRHSGAGQQLLPLMVELRARREGDPAAKAMLKKILAVESPPAQRTLLELARASQRLELGMAASCLDKAASAWGMSPALAHARARLVATNQSADAAIARFDRARKQADPTENETRRRWDLARADLLAALGRETAATRQWREMIEAHATNENLLRRAARAEAVWADRALAARVIEKLGEAVGERDLDWRIARARLLMSQDAPPQRDLARASALLVKVTRSAPYRVQPRLMLAECFNRLDNPKRALELLEEAQQLKPENASIALHRARLYQQTDQPDKAGNVLANLAGHEDLSPASLLTLAGLELRQEDLAAAADRLQRLLEKAPDHRRARGLLARVYQRRDQPEKARAIYDTLLANPDAPALVGAVGFYTAQGEFQRARSLLKRLDEVNMPADNKALLRARFELAAGNADKGIAILQEAAAAGKVRPAVWETLIIAQLQRGKTGAALAAAEKAAEAYPDQARFSTLTEHAAAIRQLASQANRGALAGSLLEAPQHRAAGGRAIELLASAGKTDQPLGEAAIQLSQLADQNPGFLALQRLMVRVYQQLGRDRDAADVAVRTMRTRPDSRQAAWLAAEALAAAGRWNQALNVSQQLRRQSGDQPLAADLMIAEAELQLGRSREALGRLQPHLKQAGEGRASAMVLSTQARALIAAGRFDQARQLLRPELSQAPRYRRLYRRLAVLVMPEAEPAARWLEELGRLTPADKPEERAALARAWRQLSERFDKPAYTDRALATLKPLADRDDAPASAYELLGIIHDNRGHAQQAIQAYRQALEKDPDRALCRNNLAMLMLQAGKPEQARIHAQRATRAAPKVATFHDTLARAYLANNQPEAAIRAARQATELAPDRLDWQVMLGEALLAGDRLNRARSVVDEIEQQRTGEADLADELQARFQSLKQNVQGASDGPSAAAHEKALSGASAS